MSDLFWGTMKSCSAAASDALGAAAAGLFQTMGQLSRQTIHDFSEVGEEFAREKAQKLEIYTQKARDMLLKLDESLNLAKEAEAERMLPKDYQDCASCIQSIGSKVGKLHNLKAVQAFFTEASQAGSRIERLIQESQKKKNFELIVKKIMEAMAGEGFQTEVEYGDNKSVWLLGQAGKKKVYLNVDQDGNLSGDFASGYREAKEGECSSDLKRFLTRLNSKEVDVKIERIKPVELRKGQSHEGAKSYGKACSSS